jgi:hypothetical protein
MGLLRNVFGPSRREVWQQLCAQIEARYVEGGLWSGDKVEATHGAWIVTLDTYSVMAGEVVITYTRMRAPYVNPDGFRFEIYRGGVFSEIAKRFGMQDVEIGDPAFDREFIIKGTSEPKLRRLFANRRLRELVSRQPEIRLAVKDDEGWFGPRFEHNVDELSFHVPGVIKDIERLKALYELFAETLEQLCEIGSAYERAPSTKL